MYGNDYQVSKFSFTILHFTLGTVPIDIISLYRSSTCTNDLILLNNIKEMVNRDNICLICGDFNIRFQNSPNHTLVNELLKLNFSQLIDQPTHRDGGIIDHLYMYRPLEFSDVLITWELFCPFYSDHHGISIVINKKDNSFIKMQTTVPDHLLKDATVSKDNPPSKTKSKGTGKKRKASSGKADPKTKPKP